MNIYGARQLANSFRTVRKNTIQVAEDIPESQYGFLPAEACRSVAQMLVHVATVTPLWVDIHGTKKLTNMDNYDFEGIFQQLEAQEKKSRSKAEIIELLRTEGEKFAAFLESLSDETLAQEITEASGGEKKTRLEALMSAKEHEMHHRAQLMLIERMLGIVPHLTRKYAEMERQYREGKRAQAKEKVAQPA
ncbi:MAG TPA: DinB family protein [Bryobacteraceae bacterium]|nr:DinB family protein [Bryobacteraceae bacterium]